MIQRGVLGELDLAGVTAAFAKAYEDYVVPLRFDAERMRVHVEVNDIALLHSPLWRDDGGLVGLAMLGVRGDRGWIGGFGIAPEHRGRGLSHTLVAEVIERARGLGLANVQLEVIDVNVRALATYERAEFVRTRSLCSYRREPATTEAEPVEEIDPGAIAWPEARPAWQHEPASVLRTPGIEALRVGEAFAVVRPTEAGVHVLARIADDEAAAGALLDGIAARNADVPVVVMNEPEGSAVELAMRAAGWTAIVRQHEMLLELG